MKKHQKNHFWNIALFTRFNLPIKAEIFFFYVCFFNVEYIYINFFLMWSISTSTVLSYIQSYNVKAKHYFVILFHMYFAILHIIIFSKATKLGHIYNISITL